MGYFEGRLNLKRLQLKNWIIKASSVVRSLETYRELRNRLSLELPFETTVPFLKFGDISHYNLSTQNNVYWQCAFDMP